MAKKRVKTVDNVARRGIAECKKEIADLNQKLESLEVSRNTLIVQDLQEKKPGLSKPMFSYSEIAERHGVSISKIQRLAEESNLSRRKNIVLLRNKKVYKDV